METVTGYIERITYQNPENGYTVAQLKALSIKDLICIVGSLVEVIPGQTIACKGEWRHHLVHGKQFLIKEYQIQAPADLLGITKYLGSGLIKGIGPAYAKKIVEKFGIDTLNIIDLQPEKLLEIEGLGEKRKDKIIECWQEQKSIRDVMIFLQSNGISPAYAQKIFKYYGAECVKKLKENPYILARDITGIGFRIADDIAKHMGLEHKSEKRIDAGIEHVLMELSNSGHVCFPLEDFLMEAKKALEVDIEDIRKRTSYLKEDFRIELFDLVHEGKKTCFIWNMPLFLAESGIAREIKRILHESCSLRDVDKEKAIDWVQQKLQITLADNQILAVKNSLSSKIQIITGGPGTGKSTITNAILSITEKLSDKIMLMAPTGKAAKRMSEITGKKATTIHSALEYDFKKGGFKRKKDNPLEADLIIIDEASMMDTYLMYSLLKAIKSSTRVIFVGDIFQLPSVGPGTVLKDLIASKVIPVTTLNEIYRQARGSRIITNAHKINAGIFPDIQNVNDSDFYFIEANEPEIVLNNIVTLVTNRIPLKYNFNPTSQIQVLTPMRKGIIGTENLNVILQQHLNKSTESIFRVGRKFLVGDKVMQTRNDHKRAVFNGEVGVIKSIDLSVQQVVVDFDEKDIVYEAYQLDELVLAYAVSIHKYQGSQCECIIIPVHTTHFTLLFRNLLYTGVTRAQKLVILVGSKKALAIATKNNNVENRFTGLISALTANLNPLAI